MAVSTPATALHVEGQGPEVAPPSALAKDANATWQQLLRATSMKQDESTCRLGKETIGCEHLREYVVTAQQGCAGPILFDPTRPLSIAVFGGSNTASGGYTWHLQKQLRALRIDATVVNMGRAGSGPGYWLQCPPVPAKGYYDLIVSEFRLNEKDWDTLLAWYRLCKNLTPSVIVLDLFSWRLGGPPFEEMGACLDTYYLLNRAVRERFTDKAAEAVLEAPCELRLGEAARSIWNKVHPFNTRGMWPTVPQECHAAQDAGDREAFRKGGESCCTKGSWGMHHGGPTFHVLVAVTLAYAIFSRLRAVGAASTPAAGIAPVRCYGIWGWNAGAVKGVKTLPEAGIRTHLFTYGALFRADKPSLHAKEPLAELSLPVPECCVGVSVGYVEHSLRGEAGRFCLGTLSRAVRNVSTWTGQQAKEATRTKAWAEVKVAVGETLVLTVLELFSDQAHIEVTDIVLRGCLP